MAGQNVELMNPGYSATFTRDLTWTPNATAEAAADNAFDPDSANPLVEGEWLEMVGTHFTRAGNLTVNPATAAGAALAVSLGGGDAGVGTSPSHLYFQERGRYDAQVTRKAHCIIGPSGMEIRTRLVVTGTDAIGDRVYVCWGVTPAGSLVRCLATTNALVTAGHAAAGGDYFVGTITRIHDTNDISVLYQPGFL
jgi:hypothetical protein